MSFDLQRLLFSCPKLVTRFSKPEIIKALILENSLNFCAAISKFIMGGGDQIEVNYPQSPDALECCLIIMCPHLGTGSVCLSHFAICTQVHKTPT